jgi:hypothetical protein
VFKNVQTAVGAKVEIDNRFEAGKKDLRRGARYDAKNAGSSGDEWSAGEFTHIVSAIRSAYDGGRHGIGGATRRRQHGDRRNVAVRIHAK